jgi:hypothetical protein
MPFARRFSDGPLHGAALNTSIILDVSMKGQCTPKAAAQTGAQAAPERIYRFSPKAVIIAGPPAGGEGQLPGILAEATRQGFKPMCNIPSHRTQSCIGPRRILHMARKES